MLSTLDVDITEIFIFSKLNYYYKTFYDNFVNSNLHWTKASF